MLPIKSGRLKKPIKAVFYGLEGTGKSTLAAQTPNPLFFDTEGGTTYLDVNRVDQFPCWESLISMVEEVARDSNCCSTLVIDTADWAEQMAIKHICEKYKQTGLESFGFGKGYTYLAEEFTRLLRACDKVLASGKNVVIVAHARVRKQELPEEMGAFDHWELKLSKQCAPLLAEWPDLLLFISYKTYVSGTENGSKKASGGKRVMYATHHPCWDAKNRFGLPDEMELDFKHLSHLFNTTTPAQAQPQTDYRAELAARMEQAAVTTEQLCRVVAAKGHFPEDTTPDQYPDAFFRQWLFPHWKKIVEMIHSDPNYCPF